MAATASPAGLSVAAPAPGPLVRLVLIGKMEAWSLASTPVLPRGRKARALLAVLGLADGAPLSRTWLAGLLWSGRATEQRRNSLRQALHEVQAALAGAGAPLQAGRHTLALPAGPVWVDALELARADAARPQALELLRAELLADLDGLDPAFDAWLTERRRALRVAAAAVAQAQTQAGGPEPVATVSAASAPRLASRGARIGVLPLAAPGPGPGMAAEEYLSVGLAEEITAALACLRWMFVVECGSLAAAAARDGVAAAAQRMALDFLLTGMVQRAGSRIRVSLRLTDLRPPGGVVWTQRFEREANDLLALQDAVAAAVVARIDPEILLIEAGRAGTRAAIGASAYELLLRAIPAIHRLDRESFLAAGCWLREATALEPDYPQALAWRAYWYMFLLGQGWTGPTMSEAQAMAEAERLASRAIALDPRDAQALTILGHVQAFVHHRVAEAAALHRRALALNPNLAMAWVFLGMSESYLGEHRAALPRLDRYRELAPCHPLAFFFDAARAVPLLLLGRHREAAAVCRDAIVLQPGFSFPQKVLLAALGHLGEAAEAAAVRTRLLAIEPGFTVAQALQRTPLRCAGDRAHYRRGLLLGGLG